MPTIAQQARAATAQAFIAAGDAKTEITLRLGPSVAYDPETDGQVKTWEQETTGLEAIGYADKNERQKSDLEKRLRSFLVKGADVSAARPSQAGEIVENNETWQIYRIETDPTRSIFIFHCTI